MAKEKLYDVAGLHFASVFHPGAAAATGTLKTAIWKAPCACKVESVFLHGDVAVVGDDTNSFSLATTNGGAAGAGTAAVGAATFAAAGGTIAALAKVDLSPAAGVAFAEGDIMLLTRTKIGTGLILGASSIQVQFRPT
jgi:hypothetical protein